jgi:transcriptional regulator NrdR family protein
MAGFNGKQLDVNLSTVGKETMQNLFNISKAIMVRFECVFERIA